MTLDLQGFARACFDAAKAIQRPSQQPSLNIDVFDVESGYKVRVYATFVDHETSSRRSIERIVSKSRATACEAGVVVRRLAESLLKPGAEERE
jgi:hypothetical protein